MADKNAERGDFPKRAYVRLDANANGEVEDLLAYRDELKAIDDDGPTVVAEYKFVGMRALKKKVTVHDA